MRKSAKKSPDLDLSANGEPAPGDVREPERIDDATFEPAALERQTVTPAEAGPDPFDPTSLRLSGDVNLGVKKVLTTIHCRKPDKSWFVRAHPDERYRLLTAVIELKEDRESYLVAPPLWPDLASEATFKPKWLVTAINRQNVVFLWEVNLPSSTGKQDAWANSALEAVNLATTRWVRVVANLSNGAYDIFYAAAQLPEPEWPAMPFRELLRIAFKQRLIDSPSHPVLRKLRGEV
jgi:hypothetical protein